MRAAALLLCALVAAGAARGDIEQQPHEEKPAPPPPPPTLDQPPVIVDQPQAAYPDEARAADVAGTVVLRIVIDETGAVERVDVLQSAAAQWATTPPAAGAPSAAPGAPSTGAAPGAPGAGAMGAPPSTGAAPGAPGAAGAAGAGPGASGAGAMSSTGAAPGAPGASAAGATGAPPSTGAPGAPGAGAMGTMPSTGAAPGASGAGAPGAAPGAGAGAMGGAPATPTPAQLAAARALDWAAMGAATSFTFAPATFCVTDVAADGTQTKRCGVPGKVAIDYKTTFQLEEKHVEVPTEAAREPAKGEKAPGVVNYEGVVREAGSKNPLEGVTVEVEVADEKYLTAATGADGRFEMRDVPPGDHRVNFTLSGYEPAFVDETFKPKERTETVIYLVPTDTSKNETVVRRRRAQKDVSKIALTRDEVKKVPGTFGDPLRVIENLPGVARAPFIGGALIVRGANPEDSGVYFDGVEIPLLYHFGGLKSVVNPEFLEDISFYPGGFGAYYGRATAGIVDVSSRKLKLKSFRGSADVNIMDADFFFAGPVQVGELPKLTFAVAARRSYVDALLPIALDALVGPTGQAVVAAPVYWDYQAKIETDPLPGQHFSLFAFGSDDDLKVSARGVGGLDLGVGFHTTFHRLVGSWDWQLAPGLLHRFEPYVGLTRVEFNAGNSGSSGPSTNAAGAIDTWVWGLRDELQLTLNENAVFRTGLDYLGQTFGVSFDVPLPIEIGSFPREFSRVTGTNQSFSSNGFNNASAVYLEAELTPWKGLKIIPGARAELTIFTFLPNKLPDGSTSDPAAAQLFHIDPRLTVRWELMPWTTVKGAFGVYRQPPSGGDINPSTGNPDLLEPRAVQLIGGVEQGLTKDIHLDVQLYYTNRDLLVQGTSQTKSANDGSGKVQPLFVDNGGRGNTIGAEILLRHEITEHFYGWIAYTLSRTELDLDENSDRFTVSSNDQTHILTVVAQTNLPYGFTVGARYRLVSGDPTNVPLGSVHDLDTTNYLQLGTTRSSTRLPTFHQLDVRVDKKFVFDTFSLTAYLDVLNVYNQQNAEGFVTDYRSREQEPIPSLPVVPVLGLSGEF